MSYDAWLATPPEPRELPLPGEPFYPRCGGCGAFLKRDAERSEEHWLEDECRGEEDLVYGYTDCGKRGRHPAHPYVIATWTELYRRCRRCGHVDMEVQG